MRYHLLSVDGCHEIDQNKCWYECGDCALAVGIWMVNYVGKPPGTFLKIEGDIYCALNSYHETHQILP